MENNYEEKFLKLKEISKKLEDSNLSLDEALSSFEESIGLIKECASILENAKQKVKVLSKDGSLEDFNKES